MEILEIAPALRGIGSGLFGLAVLWGASKIMAAGGEPKMMEEGKNIVKNAVIGFVLLMLGTLIPSMAPPNIEPIYFNFP